MRKSVWLVTACVLLLAATSARGAKEFEGVTLNVNGFGGGFDEVLKATVARPLKDKYGIDVVYHPGTALQAISKIMAARDTPPLDILMNDSPNMPTLIADGVIDQVTEREIPSLAQLYKPAREFGNHGVPFMIASVVLSYNKERVQNPPASYLDLARPEYKGRVAMFNLENNGGILTLLALAEASGGGVNDIEPGFARLRELKPNLVSTPAANPALVQLFQQGEAWVAANWIGRVLSLQADGFPVESVVPKEGMYAVFTYVNLVKNSTKRAAALKYLEQQISAEAQVGMATKFFYAPTNVTVKLPADVAKKVVVYGDDIKLAKRADWAVIAKNRGAWIERWNREMK
ncbi:MAG: ABC transporter substrate-binding protein [Candidatus Rokuibacteriota bacterium]